MVVANKVDRFLDEAHAPNTYNAILKKFLLWLRKGKGNRRRGVSKHTIARLFYTLCPIGEKFNNPPIQQLTRGQLKEHINERWLHYSRDSMRTLAGDMRQFFKWCKKKGYTKKNLAKQIEPIGTRRRHRRKSKAAPERDIRAIMEYLIRQLKESGLIHLDLFGVPQVSHSDWPYDERKALRDLFVVTFLYETGARPGELSALGSKAINEAIKRPSRAYLITAVGKTKERDYYFTNATANLWRMWQKIRPIESDEYAVVGWRKGHKPRQMLTNGISQMIFRRCEEVGKRPFRAGALRHAKVKRARRAVGLEMASILIDHSNLDTTRNYANIEDDEVLDAATKTGLLLDLWGSNS